MPRPSWRIRPAACRSTRWPAFRGGLSSIRSRPSRRGAEIPILVETASPDLRGEVEAFARCLSRTVLYADSTLRGQVHLAGVFACNFANHLFELGGEVLRRAGVSADLLRPLIAETTAKALAAARPAAVQTGPAVRGDLPTQERHLRLLADDALLSDIYRLITQSIWETSRKIS